MKFLRSLFAGLLAVGSVKAAEQASTKNPADMMRAMRQAWLEKAPEKGSYKSDDEVVAVVMDWPMGDQTISVLSSSGGDASLYTTGTFGIIGGIGHEKVRKAAVAFTDCAHHYLALTKPTKDFPYPDGQTLRFYMLTPAGVRTVSFPMKEIDRVDSDARALFAAAQNVVTELRLIVPNPK